MREMQIRSKLMEISESVEVVSSHLPDDLSGFISLGLTKDGIYKRLEFSIENVFDICAMINSDLNLGIPEGDESIIDNLLGAHVLSSEWHDKLRGMKAFRNIMVHRYGKIDDRIAFSLLKDRLDDLVLFIEDIDEFLSIKKGS